LRHPSAAGFTLIEVVISAALMSMILVGAYMCLNAGFASQKLIEPRVEVTQNARVAMAMLTADLRSACPLSTNYDFLGMQRTVGKAQADNLDFATHNYTPTRPNEADFCEVSYYGQKDRKTGKLSLWCRRNPTIAADPLTGGKREEIVRGLQGVRFEYFDGFDWYDTWGELNTAKAQSSNKSQPNLTGMPDAVRITLAFDPNPNAKPTAPAAAAIAEEKSDAPLVFQTVVRLELTAGLRNAPAPSSGGDSSSPDNNNNNNNGGQPGPNNFGN